MFDFFTNLFKNDNSSSFYSFYKKMVGWRESGVYPFPYNLPSSITFPEDFWRDIIKIYKQTSKDGLERAISLFWTDGELIVTSIVKGDNKSVNSNHKVAVNYIPHPTRKGYLRRHVVVDGKIIKKRDVYYKKAPRKVIVEYLFNMHTHPPQVLNDQSKVYTFFSAQDISSFISSKAVITGLITDRFWFLVRTSETPSSVTNLEQHDITVQNLTQNLNMGVYEAQFKQKAIRK